MDGRRFCLVVLFACVGCSATGSLPSQPEPETEPIGMQVLRLHPELKSQRFSDLLNFESSSDLVFLESPGTRAEIDSNRVHTGRSSVRLGSTTTIRLGSVLGNREFPDTWTLMGGYFWSDRPAKLTLTWQMGQTVLSKQTTSLPPRQWTPAMVDLLLAPRVPAGSEMVLSIGLDAPGGVWLDDLILIDNTAFLLGVTDGQSDWTLSRRGFGYYCMSRDLFAFRLPSIESDAAGWKVEEANPVRMRFSSSGAEKSLTVYRDGRSYRDGVFAGLSDETRAQPLWQQQMQSPAQIQVAESMGRVNRTSHGDANNDGFNESRGAYAVLAAGPRLELMVLPRSVPVLNPVLEVGGLPAGQALVTVEGSLVERTARQGDGTLVVELPLRIDRPVTVNVRVQ